MTSNYIAWLNYGENKRHNVAYENETHRNNVAVLEETKRHNVVNETETHRHNVAIESETNRHNVVTELVSMNSLAETVRSHKANEEIAQGNLIVYRDLSSASASQAQAALVSAAAAQLNAKTNAYNAETSRLQLNIQQQNADTNAANAKVNSRNADTNRFNAMTNSSLANSTVNLNSARQEQINISNQFDLDTFGLRMNSLSFSNDLALANIALNREKANTEKSNQAANYAKSFDSVTHGVDTILSPFPMGD